MRAPRLLVLSTTTFVLTVAALTPRAQDTPIMTAMRDELQRSMKELRLRDQPAPYYIEYEVWDRAQTRVTSRLGALVDDLRARSRTLRVNVRVGSYDFDNSLFNAPGMGGGGVVDLAADGSISAPLDEDYDAMRRQIWLATDAAYKRAVSLFARKRAAFQNRATTGDAIPDFSREEPAEAIGKGLPLEYTNQEWPERAKQISAVFASVKGIEGGDVVVSDTRGTRYFVNSEGSRVVAPLAMATLRVNAEARAGDGTVVRDVFTLVEKRLEDLPAVAELVARSRAMAERLGRLREAPIAEEYAGPVLLEGPAAAELIAQVLLPPTLARRPSESAGRGGRAGTPPAATPFLRRIGLRVMTEPFSLVDKPSLREWEGRPVPGSYEVDDYGLAPKDVTVVEKGRLVTLLTGRTPLKGFLQSSGRTRGGDVQPSVVLVESSTAVPATELRAKYLELLETQDRDYGYIIRSLASPGDVPGGGGGGPVILHAVKVDKAGKEELVRGLRLTGVAAASFRDLLDASRERTLYNFRATSVDAISVIAPNMIFEELEIQQTREIAQKPPVVPSPLEE